MHYTPCTDCKVHFSLVSGHLLVFHRRCWVVCCLLKVVEADITLHNGLIDINLPIYVHPCCHIVHLFLVGFLSSLRDWLLLPWRQADADCWGWSTSFWPQLNNSPPSSHQKLILSCNLSRTFTFNADGKVIFAVTHPFVVKAFFISPISDW